MSEPLRILERLHRLEPSSSALATDLSAAYLLQGLALDRPEMFADAIEILDALDSGQLSEPAKENLAFALQQLKLEADGESHDPSLEAAASGPVLLSQAIEDLLPKWADAVFDEEAGNQMALRNRIVSDGDQLWHSNNDNTLLAIADLLDRNVTQTAIGIASYAEGLTSLRQLRLEEAEARFHAAVRGWPRAPVLRRWARYQLGILAYQQAEYDRALASFSKLREELAVLDEPLLAGRVEYMTALIYAIQGNHDAFRSHTRRALAFFEKANDSTGVARSLQDLAVVDRTLGNVESAWRHAVRAKSLTDPSGAPDAAFNVTLTLGELARETGRLRTAERLIQQLSELANRTGTPQAWTAAMREAAKLSIARGHWRKACEFVEQALTLVGKIPDMSVQQSMISDLLLVRAGALARTDREQAVRDLESSIRSYESSDYRLFLPDLEGMLASLLRQEGDSPGSRRAFTSALAELEAQLSSLDSVTERSQLLDSARNLYSSVIVDYANHGNWSAAFFRAEQARSRLSDSRSFSSRQQALGSMVARPSSSEGMAVVSYYVSDRELFAWTMSGGRFTGQRLLLSRQELESRLDDLEDTIRTPDLATDAIILLKEFFEELLQPLDLDWEELTRLVVVPDGPLRAIPFSALVDPTSQRFLIEKVAIVLMPNTPTTLRPNANFPGPPPGRTHRVLLVEGPSGAGLDLGLPPLSRIAQEIDQVAGQYENVALLRGPTATRAAVIEQIEQAEVFHFAGHARSSALDDGSNGLFLSGPGTGHTELLSTTDLTALRAPRLRLAVLAACETGSRGTFDRPGPMSLADSFLSLGADEVIGALWSVDDEYTSAFSVSIHKHLLDSDSAAQALQKAKLEAIRDRAVPLSVWAAFESYGQARLGNKEVTH